MNTKIYARKIALSLVLIVLLGVSLLTACQTATPTTAPTVAPTEAPSVPAVEPTALVLKLRVGVSPVPHGDIVNFVKDTLAPIIGLEIEVVEFSDYVLPNLALNDGSIDVNFFQHLPYLTDFNASNGTDLVSVAGVHIEPLSIYSKTLKSLDELADGTVVAIPNDASNGGRALNLLAANGLLKLKEGVGYAATVADITENPKNLKISELEAAQLVRSLEDTSISVINGNYALQGGLTPAKDALALESSENNPYVNILAVKHGNEGNPAVQAFVALITSDEVKQFIEEKYAGSVIPAFTVSQYIPQ